MRTNEVCPICNTYHNSSCFIYEGEYFSLIDAQPGDTISSIFKKLDTILSEFNGTTPGTTTSTTTTRVPTLCDSVPEMTFYDRYDSDDCGNFIFNTSLSDAQIACENFHNSCTFTSIYGEVWKLNSLSEGEIVYNAVTCEQASETGYYIVTVNNPKDTIVYIISGVIQSITTCYSLV